MAKRSYLSLQDWLERTGTPQKTLAKLADIKAPHMSRILSRSRRCSVEKAMRLSAVTGVPVEKLVEWKSMKSPAMIERASKLRAEKAL